jgi:hypothetical protein
MKLARKLLGLACILVFVLGICSAPFTFFVTIAYFVESLSVYKGHHHEISTLGVIVSLLGATVASIGVMLLVAPFGLGGQRLLGWDKPYRKNHKPA